MYRGGSCRARRGLSASALLVGCCGRRRGYARVPDTVHVALDVHETVGRKCPDVVSVQHLDCNLCGVSGMLSEHMKSGLDSLVLLL